MKRKFCASFLAAVLAALPSFAADLADDYTVSEDGATYTLSEGWSALDVGMTIVMKYENLPAEGDDVSLMTLSQYAPNGDESKVGLCSRARLPRGTWNGGYWNNAQNTSTTSLGESGVVVCVYKPVKGNDKQGLLAYSSTGALIFSANGLKSTTDGSTVGKKIVITEYVTDVAIYQGEVAADGIAALVEDYERGHGATVEMPATAFEWTPGTNPTGWITSWTGENGGAPKTVIGPGGVAQKYVVYEDGTQDSKKWHPYSTMQAKFTYTLALYACTDLVKTPAKGEYAVLWAMGAKAGRQTMLVMDSERSIGIVHGTAGKIQQTIFADEEVVGYHLITVTFNPYSGSVRGMTLRIDANDPYQNTSITYPVANLQIGSVYQGCPTGFNIGKGLIVNKMIGYDSVLTDAQIGELARQYPAVTELDGVLTAEVEGDVILPNVELKGSLALGANANLKVLPNADLTIAAQLTGEGAVELDPGAGRTVTLTRENSFTGGLTVASGTAKQTVTTGAANRGFGPNRYGNYSNAAQIAVEKGATLDLANTKDACYAITSAGTISNGGEVIGYGSRQTTRITLTEDATVSGKTFGLLAPGHNPTALDLGGHTLTITMAEGNFFILDKTTIESGMIRLEQGGIHIINSLAGEFTLDLPTTPTIGTRVFDVEGTPNFENLTVNLTVNGVAPSGLRISNDGYIQGTVAVVEKNGTNWMIDTTGDAYTLTEEEIAALKVQNCGITVTLKSTSSSGATIDLGTMSARQGAHYVIESGTHTLKWFGNTSSMNFDTLGTADNPSILVKNGATLDFYAKDVTGWANNSQNASRNVFRVNEGGTINLYKNGDNTFFFAGRWYLEPGALLEAKDYESTKVRLNGGVNESYPQIYVPSPTSSETTATYRSNVGFQLAKDSPQGYGICVEKGATLVLDGNLTSDGAHNLSKWGEGRLTITGSLDGMSGAIVLNSGSVAIKEAEKFANVIAGESATRRIVATTEGEWTIYAFEDDVIVVNGETSYSTVDEALLHVKAGDTIEVRDTSLVVDWEAKGLDVSVEGGVVTVLGFKMAEGAVLRFSEIMPKPSDKPYSITTQDGYDKNGLESGWVELYNDSNSWADLADYKFLRVNRSKATSKGDYGNFPSVRIPPKSHYVFYTSERYSNSVSQPDSAFVTGTFDGKPKYFPEYDMMIWGDKINPKKFPFVRLVYTPSSTIVDTVVIPSDIPEGNSIIVTPVEDGKATVRYLTNKPTKGTANPTDVSGLEKLGPNVGPLYEIAGGAKHDSASEFGVAVPQAQAGEDYTINFSLNPTMSPTVVAGFRDEDAIDSIKLIYRTWSADGPGKEQERAVSIPETVDFDATDLGYRYTATIPAANLPEPGQLVQWKFEVTDAVGNTWMTPSFHNKDDGYEWYGTIVAPTEEQKLISANLTTWHMFVDSASRSEMDVDEPQQKLANNARIAIYDSTSQKYYDYVRIDLRGNTSKAFRKKSHGLRFSKANPLEIYDPVRGKTWSGIRKSSLIGEPADPSYMRQMMSFWLWDKMGNHVPFDFPVRCNLNGEFFQLAFHSERFTDELIEDVYGLDKYGYGYKNVGQLNPSASTSAGGIEKKTPDDGNEKDISVLKNELLNYISSANNVESDVTGTSEVGLDDSTLTKFVVEKFNLPAWLNYLASARITQEMDDVWANISIYYDNGQMLEGTRGTGTWMPLGYDFNLSLGQWYYNDVGGGRTGLIMSDQDWFKSHPFYGGKRVRAYKKAGYSDMMGGWNYGIESVLQNAKFRRLYLRRLRTLMDQELKAPGTEESEVPLMVKMREIADLMREDATIDRAKYPWDGSIGNIDVWGSAYFPKSMDAGIEEIWTKYIQPRQIHLFETHSIDDPQGKGVGYGSDLCAGIPAAQSPIASLKDKITIANLTELSEEEKAQKEVDSLFLANDVLIIHNANDEAVDMSGWKLEFSVDYTLPAGTVIDADDDLYVVADRRAYVTAHESELTDQIIIGNATMTGAGPIRFTAADGTVIVEKIPRTDARDYLRLDSFYGNTADGISGDTGEWITIKNVSDDVTLNFKNDPVSICFIKDETPLNEGGDHCHFTLSKGTLKPGATMTLNQADYAEKGWVKIQNNKQIITISDKYGTTCEQLKVTQKNFDLAYGNGAYLKIENDVWRQVYDLAIGTKVYTLDILEEVAAQLADGVVIRLGIEAEIDETEQTIAFAADKVLAIPTENFTITVADQKAGLGFKQITLTAKVQPDAGEIPEGATVYSGEVEGDIDLAAGTYYLNGANFTGNVTCSGAVTLHLVSGAENTAKFIDASAAGLTIKGMGKLSMSGTDTLIKAKTMVVNEGVLSIEFSGDVEKEYAVLLTGPYIQNGGEVTIDLNSEVQVYGFFLDTKTSGINAVELNGGVFNSTIAGSKGYDPEMEGGVPGSATFKLNKGSNDASLNGTEINIVSSGLASRFINTDGHIFFTENCGVVSVASADASAINAKIFKSAKSLEIAGGVIKGNVIGSGSEIFSSDLEIVVSGGVVNVTAADDCFSAATLISVTGGVIHAVSEAGDALDSNGSMSLTGGYVFAFTKSSEHEALDVMPSTDDGVTHTLTIDAGATVVAVSGKTPEVEPEGAADTFMKSFASTSNKFVGFTTVTKTDTLVITKNYALSWEGKIAASPTILIAGSGLADAKADIKNPGKDNPDYVNLDENIAKLTVKTTEVENIKPSGATTWEEVEVTEDTTVEELVGANQGAVLEALKVEPAKIVDWAKTYAADSKPGEAIDLVAFALNCAPNEEAIDAAKKNFKVTITMTEEGPVAEIESGYYNITPVLKGKAILSEEEWVEVTEENKNGFRFFRGFIEIGGN